MNHQFLDIPHFVSPTVYDNTIKKIVGFLKNESSILAIYKLGNVNHPGISDIDIIVVFKNNTSCGLNPNDYFTSEDRYLVTHELAGASEDNFKKILPYTFWDNLQCIWGEDITTSIPVEEKTLAFKKEYQEQIGWEFLVKNFLDIGVQQKYGVIKLRSLLQEIKGVRYDLKFLGIKEMPINQLIEEFLLRLDVWFQNPFNPKEFSTWLANYHKELQNTIEYLNESGTQLWLPREHNLKYGRNVHLHQAEQLDVKSSGIFLPAPLINRSKKWYNAHLRLNQFSIGLNFTINDPKNIHSERIKTFQQYKADNAKNYPHFGALHSSLVDNFI